MSRHASRPLNDIGDIGSETRRVYVFASRPTSQNAVVGPCKSLHKTWQLDCAGVNEHGAGWCSAGLGPTPGDPVLRLGFTSSRLVPPRTRPAHLFHLHLGLAGARREIVLQFSFVGWRSAGLTVDRR